MERTAVLCLGSTERSKLVGHVLAAVVAVDDLDARTGLGLGRLGELLKLVQHFRLAAKQEHCAVPQIVVNEYHKVAFYGERHSLHMAAHIAVNDVEHVLGAQAQSTRS